MLPGRKRQALCAVYAFMRRCDDIADDDSSVAIERRQKLTEWLDAFSPCAAAQPTDDPVLLALTDAQHRYQDSDWIARPVRLRNGDGFAVDPPWIRLRARPPVPHEGSASLSDFRGAAQYCYRVASVVGLVCIKIFGYRDPAAESLAERCGLAFQLTNIIRDVKEDAAMGRVYLPQEDLDAIRDFGCPHYARLSTPAVFARCWRWRRTAPANTIVPAKKLIPLVNEDSRPAFWVLITIYRRLLEKIALRQYDVFSGKVRLSVR